MWPSVGSPRTLNALRKGPGQLRAGGPLILGIVRGYASMRGHRPESCRLGLILLLIALCAGCGSSTRSRGALDEGIAVLQRVDENSDWSFSPTKTSLEVQPDGVSVLIIEGRALPKPDASGALWAPLLLVRELPAYYRLEG